MNQETRLCTGCNTEKSVLDFSKNKTRKNGRNGHCKSCNKKYRGDNIEYLRKCNLEYKEKNKGSIKEKRPDYIEKNREKVREMLWRNKLKQRYNLTPSQYKSIFELQNGKCAICDRVSPLSVDHCHQSKKVRGLLCGSCNRGLGLFGESIESLKNAIVYLKKHKEL